MSAYAPDFGQISLVQTDILTPSNVGDQFGQQDKFLNQIDVEIPEQQTAQPAD